MGFNLRKATKEDCPRLLELIRELAIYEKEPDAVTVRMDEFEDAGFGDHPVWEAFVVEDKKNIVGMSLFYIRYSTWKGRRLYLEDLIVTESYRGKGIGQILLDETIAYAKSKKYNGIMWQVLDWNAPAIRFYERYQAHFDGEWMNVSINFEE